MVGRGVIESFVAFVRIPTRTACERSRGLVYEDLGLVRYSRERRRPVNGLLGFNTAH
jgi:hypothetical protein